MSDKLFNDDKVVKAILDDDVFMLLGLINQDIDVTQPIKSSTYYHYISIGGFTPLMIACCEEKVDVAEMLIEFYDDMGGDINAKNGAGITAFFYAANRGIIEILKAFKKNKDRLGLDVNSVYETYEPGGLQRITPLDSVVINIEEASEIIKSMGGKSIYDLEREG